MPCDSVPQTTAQKNTMKDALKRLELMLEQGGVGVKIGSTGAVAFDGWTPLDRKGWTDVCAFRALSAEGSFALRVAVQRAESQAGRKLDQQQVAAGVHSHDGGRTFHPGH